MAVRTNDLGVDGSGVFPYAEIDITHGGEDYIVRLTAVPPYRNKDTDELNAHVDYFRASTGESRRYEGVTIPAKGQGEKRRESTIRLFKQFRGQGVSIPSPHDLRNT